jgi:hypothetical protein
MLSNAGDISEGIETPTCPLESHNQMLMHYYQITREKHAWAEMMAKIVRSYDEVHQKNERLVAHIAEIVKGLRALSGLHPGHQDRTAIRSRKACSADEGCRKRCEARAIMQRWVDMNSASSSHEIYNPRRSSLMHLIGSSNMTLPC